MRLLLAFLFKCYGFRKSLSYKTCNLYEIELGVSYTKAYPNSATDIFTSIICFSSSGWLPFTPDTGRRIDSYCPNAIFSNKCYACIDLGVPAQCSTANCHAPTRHTADVIRLIPMTSGLGRCRGTGAGGRDAGESSAIGNVSLVSHPRAITTVASLPLNVCK